MSVAGHVKTLEDREGDLACLCQPPKPPPRIGERSELRPQRPQEPALTYDAHRRNGKPEQRADHPAGESWLGVWVYGDGSGNTLMATITRTQPPVPAVPADRPGLHRLEVRQRRAARGRGHPHQPGRDLWRRRGEPRRDHLADQFTTSNENVSDTIAPTVRLSVSGTQLTAAVSDNVDRTIPQANVILTYDGRL